MPTRHSVGGFNTSLVPSTSQGPDVGIRGSLGFHLYYDVTLFYLQTQNDFERYRMVDRPLETFYANGGDSSRYGLETEARWLPTRWLTISGSYTYSHFTYFNYWSKTYPGDLSGQFSAERTEQHVLQRCRGAAAEGISDFVSAAGVFAGIHRSHQRDVDRRLPLWGRAFQRRGSTRISGAAFFLPDAI